MAVARRSGRVRRVPGPGGDVLVEGRCGVRRVRPCQAAVAPQTCRWAGAVRVVMVRGACGNACLDLILWSRWRCRSVVTRAVAITARAWWWAAARAGAGSEAVAAPVRTVLIRVRRAVVNDRCGGATG